MKFYLSVLSIFLLSFLKVPTIQAQQVAFPGAEGHGMYTTGGRGGRVIKVTNLNDSGEGSLRAAVEASGPRIVVFEVSGTIPLESKLFIRNDSITIAGQTAPGDGICVRNYCVYITASNVIIRFMRFRMGDEAKQVDDALGGQGSRNMIIDHCSMSWSIDECASFYANEDFTMQWCLLTESLRNSFHEGLHGYGGIWGGNRASFHHNLLAHHSNRNPRFRGNKINRQTDAELMDFRNNVIYNYNGTSYGSEGGGSYNMVNNYYKYGPATDDMDKEILFVNSATAEYNWLELEGAHGRFYVDGNYISANEGYTADNWRAVVWEKSTTIERVKSEVEFDKGTVTTDDAETAYLKVLEHAGASLYRDTVDRRTIHDTRTGTATVMDGGSGSTNGYIDTQEAVGGWPVLNSLPAPVDTDDDGMPDAWELARGLDPDDPTDGNGDRDHDLYTNIEEYINSLAPGYYDTDPFINTVQPQKNETFIAEGDASIDIEVYSNDYNGGSVTSMELYLDDALIGIYNDTTAIITTLDQVSHGMHQVVVKATDDSANVSVDTTIVYVGTKEVKVTVEAAPHGRVVLDPPGGIYTEGIDLEVTAIPDEGCVFHGWIKDFETTHKRLQIITEKDITLKPVFLKDPEKRSTWYLPVKINFQPEIEYAVPQGYIADVGGKYCEKWNGYTYGWIEGLNPANGLNSGESGVWKTFHHFENGGNRYTWEMELPRGIYRIRLGLGGKIIMGWPVETELKINVEGILVEDDDGVDLLDEHILESVPVLDGQLTLTSVEQSRICFIEIELLELASPRSITVENGSGDGDYYPDLGERILVIADTPPDGQVFDRWTGDTGFLEDVYSSSTFVTLQDKDVHISATYKNTEQDPAHYLIVVNGTGSGFYASGTEVEITAPETLGDGFFSHWECDCVRPVTLDSQVSSFTFSMPDANAVLEPVYEIPASGEGDIYQAEEAHWDNASAVERYYDGYYGTGYVNFGDDRGSFVQFENIDGKEGGYFSIKIRYSLHDPSREGLAMINGSGDTLLMEVTGSWSRWDEAEVIASLEPGKVNTIRIETTGDDLGFIDQIQVQETEYSGIEYQERSPMMKVSCYPNPFDDYAMVSFELSEAEHVNIVMYDLQGQIVRNYSSQFYNKGIHNLRLDKDILKPGLYFLSLTTNQSNNTIKILIY
jgi:hypothetical protein